MLKAVYVRSVVFLLFLTAAGKLALALGNASVLDEPSPLLGFVRNWQLLCFAATLETTAASLALVAGSNTKLACLPIAMFATALAGYRAALWLTGFQGYCQCLGSLSEALGLSDHQANTIALAVAGYCFLGSYAILLEPRHDGADIWKRQADQQLLNQSHRSRPTP